MAGPASKNSCVPAKVEYKLKLTKHRAVVLHENMSSDEIRRLEEFLDEGHYIFKELRLSDKTSILLLQYYVDAPEKPQLPEPPEAPPVEYIKEGQIRRDV